MLKLLFAPSGAGKTARIIRELHRDIQNGVRCFLLVPEQQAYISERDLPSLLPMNAGLYFEVVHFSGLADDVFREYGGITDAPIHPGIRSLLMWETMRTLSPMLACYGKSAAKDTTLSQQMLATVDELHANGIDSEQLERAADKLSTSHPLRGKLLDLALIEATFHRGTQSIPGASDLSDKLLRMSHMLDEHDYFSDCHVYIDSFTGFTVQELSVLRRILQQAKKVSVALCTNAPISRLPHFQGVNDTARRLERMALECGIPIEKECIELKNSARPLPLQILGRDLWRFDREPTEKDGIPTDVEATVRMQACANLYEEAECAALNILELVQGGMRFGDIAVIMRDAEAYRGILDAALERHQIPYFLSERTDFSSKPLSRLILSALRAIAHGFRSSDIMALLKTGLTGVDRRDGALFEEYCETWHITGNRFRDSLWSMNPDGLTATRSPRAEEILDAANRVREAIMKPLIQLEAELRQSELLSDRCRAIYHYLCRIQVSEQLAARAKRELSMGEAREAAESLRLYRFAIDTLTELATLFPDARMSIEESATALGLLFAASDLGSVPETHDCVILGSASTLRVENVKASLLLGLCEGEFPRAVTDDGILTEGDKCTLEGLGIVLDSREQRRTADELFYVYRAVTKPTERLFLSTVTANTDASPRSASIAFSRIATLLGITPEHFSTEDLPTSETASKKGDYERYCAMPMPAGSELWLSQSKINSFFLCPYRYYCTYRLKLRDQKDSTTTYADDGLFLHSVLEHTLKASLQEDGSLVFPQPSELEAFVDGIIDHYIEEVCPMPKEWMDNRLLHLFARLRGIALLILRDLFTELENSRFVPTYFEQRIGSMGENGIPPVSIPLTDGSTVRLSGVIDRVDLYREDEKMFVRVVDYKTSEHKFDISKVRSGEDIQLILYLHALLSAAPDRFHAAGAEFLYTASEDGTRRVLRSGLVAEEEPLMTAIDTTEEKSYLKGLKKLPTEEISTLIGEMRETVAALARRILDGEATKTPSEDACKYCPVAEHCDRAYRK